MISRSGLWIISKQQVVVVAELSGDRLGVRIEQQFRVIEAKTPLRPILAAHLVAVELAGAQSFHARMPDKLLAIGQLDDVGGIAVGFVEEKEKDFARMLR